jgi:hypothetical protein
MTKVVELKEVTHEREKFIRTIIRIETNNHS